MPTVESMTLQEIEATMAALRARRKTLKATSTVNQRKIVTLARRRERLMQQVSSLDGQISQLRGKPMAPPHSDPQLLIPLADNFSLFAIAPSEH